MRIHAFLHGKRNDTPAWRLNPLPDSEREFEGSIKKVTLGAAAEMRAPDHHDLDTRLASLMRSAQTGDAEAYVTLMQDRMVRRRRAFLEDADVEDLVQDVLLSVHAVRATYDATRPFLPWLLAITRNRLADAARRHTRHAAGEVIVEDLDVTFSTEQTNTMEAVSGDPIALKEAIASLPAGQRSAIELLKLREMSLKEAAAVSGTSVGALKVATHRAMDALRRRLNKPPQPR
jgi:RNA polymerase sigma-70 factor (ECF subfamily)